MFILEFGQKHEWILKRVVDSVVEEERKRDCLVEDRTRRARGR